MASLIFLFSFIASAEVLLKNKNNPEDPKNCSANSYNYNDACICNPGFELTSENKCERMKPVEWQKAKYTPETLPGDKFLNSCSSDEARLLAHTIGYAKEIIKRNYAYATYYITNDVNENTLELKRAADTLQCIHNQLSTMSQECHSEKIGCRKNAIAYVNWRFGSTIHWCEKGQNKLDKTEHAWNLITASTLIHEASHKCGTFDWHREVGRFVTYKGGSSWADIASTYQSWALHGFCYPDENSKAYCNETTKTYPPWMENNNTYVPTFIDERAFNKLEEKRLRYENGEINEDSYNFIINEEQ